ncbi:VOC family protein [Methylopila turkensis]|uniref:VOC family protein n=1 Tax=Methylopila turkensis TaxID=1437816 RepID=A0A9W6JRF3_9HYPH|nr:VOC family protein [Methylopila turkensis]GLK81216.1 VOC family protein [Methylopila turkensis]
MHPSTQKIIPNLWFDRNAEEAVAFYVSLFDDGRVASVARYGADGPGPVGEVMAIGFEIAGQSFAAINGGPHFSFTGAISLFIGCSSQAELDTLWAKLSDGGAPQSCGWIVDRFGVTWQVNAAEIGTWLADPDAERSARVMRAMLPMTKIDIAALRRAYDGG